MPVASICVICASTADYLTDAQALASPTVTLYPVMFSAVVPIYRLDALTAAGITLILSRANYALIYMGLITNWADPRLQKDNPSVKLPNLGITIVYQNESVTTNAVTFSSMAKFHPNFTQYAGTDRVPSLPLSSYYSSIPAVGAGANTAAVVSTDGTIGYAAQAVALASNVAIAMMVNRANTLVTATADSVTFAVVELGTQLLSRSTAQMDLTDGTGSSVWPIVLASYVMMDTANSRSTCHARQASVDFCGSTSRRWSTGCWLRGKSKTLQIHASCHTTSDCADSPHGLDDSLLAVQYAPVPDIVMKRQRSTAEFTDYG